jgi:hypothetical protein
MSGSAPSFVRCERGQRITATSFVNEYHWGDFRGNPDALMERYFDAFLYLANWGTRRLMIRLPRGLLDLGVAERATAPAAPRRHGEPAIT